MKGLIVINAYPNGEKFIRQATRIAEEFENLGVTIDVLRNGEVYAMITDIGEVEFCGLSAYDFVVYLDKDKYLGDLLEKGGVRLFNSARAVEICDDKMKTYTALVGKGLPLAECIPAPLCYTPNVNPDEVFLNNVAKKLGFPLIVKESYGSFGKGVYLVHGIPELIKIEQELLHKPHFFQRYVHESCGRDIRVIVIGGKAVMAMERVAQGGEFRSNVELGGEGRKTQVSEKYARVAERAAQSLGLDYCGVDLLCGKDGPIVCEVNSNAFFEGLEKTTGFNVAAAYAKYIFSQIS